MADHKTADTPTAERVYETPPTERPITEAEAARAAKLSANEHIKIASGYLRGTLAEGLLKNATGAISDDDGQLVKFHGCTCRTTATCGPSGPGRSSTRPIPS